LFFTESSFWKFVDEFIQFFFILELGADLMFDTLSHLCELLQSENRELTCDAASLLAVAAAQGTSSSSAFWNAC
jgi:hypothetical protein